MPSHNRKFYFLEQITLLLIITTSKYLYKRKLLVYVILKWDNNEMTFELSQLTNKYLFIYKGIYSGGGIFPSTRGSLTKKRSNSNSQHDQIEVAVCILKFLRKSFSIIKIYHSNYNSFHIVFTWIYCVHPLGSELVRITP